MSRLSIEDYRAFVAVLDTGSFVSAADALYITQSGLSRRIRKLEDALGARLLNRDKRQITRTAVGELFAPIAREAIAGFERSQDRIRDVIGLRAGRVTVGCMLTVANHLLAGIVSRFAQQHPGVEVRVLDDFGPKVLEAVLHGEAEFAVLLEPPAQPRITFEPLLDDPYVVALPASHPLAARKSVRWRELEHHPRMRLGDWNGNQETLAREGLAGRESAAAMVEVQHVSTLLALVAEGVGIAAAPRLAVAGQDRPGIVFRPLTHPTTTRRIGLVTVRDRVLSPAAEAFAGMLGEALSAHGPRSRVPAVAGTAGQRARRR